MINIDNLGVILEKTDLPFENQAVLNPTCIEKDGITHMFYRAVRHQNYSSIGYCQLKENKVIERLDRPFIEPEYHFERHGTEDPRIVFLDGIYYLFYTAYDGKDARAAYATSTNLIHFQKQGLVFPTIKYKEAVELFKECGLPSRYFWYETHYEQTIGPDVLLWEKDTFIFPKKFDGKFLLVHRVMPGIQTIVFNDFAELTIEFWKKYLHNINNNILMNPEFWFENRKIGGGCVPLQTKDGWLFIYHGVEDRKQDRIYHAAAALMDLKNPTKIIGRLSEPLFSPTDKLEKEGSVPNVVFPTSAIIKNNTVYVYYGAADSRIMAKAINLNELLGKLKNNPV
jgi:predicted GH43/DUF377 family glycosyl hydrolase